MPAYTILVVEDDSTIREVIVDVLSLEGYEPVTANNGEQALSLISESSPDLIFLDMRMPGLNGWDVARELARRGLNIPIVVMTAATNAKKWANDIHAQAYLAKPFDISDLLEMTHRFLPSPN